MEHLKVTVKKKKKRRKTGSFLCMEHFIELKKNIPT